MLDVIVTATDDSLASVSDTFKIEVKSYVGIADPLADLEIILYPNPNDGKFVIETDMLELKNIVVEIFNTKGIMVWNNKITEEIGPLHQTVDISNLPEGLYLLTLRTNSAMISKRFIIAYQIE